MNVNEKKIEAEERAISELHALRMELYAERMARAQAEFNAAQAALNGVQAEVQRQLGSPLLKLDVPARKAWIEKQPAES